jgi:hypothetical protein
MLVRQISPSFPAPFLDIYFKVFLSSLAGFARGQLFTPANRSLQAQFFQTFPPFLFPKKKKLEEEEEEER